jgi:hypothetical protein
LSRKKVKFEKLLLSASSPNMVGSGPICYWKTSISGPNAPPEMKRIFRSEALPEMERVFWSGDAGEGKLKTFKYWMLGRLDFSKCLLTHAKGEMILTKQAHTCTRITHIHYILTLLSHVF